MRQHAIPQNILDVEFKIFTKFTLKEFAYLAIGVGTGGIFLYMYAKGEIPGIIALPVFVVSSAIGIFFALVPINDQPADQFIRNFINAIRKPTRRVWLDNDMKISRKEKDAEIAKEQAKKNMEAEVQKKNIIGGSTKKKEEINDQDMDLLKDTGLKPIKQETQQTSSKTFQEKQLVITSENIKNFQFEIKGFDNLPGNINLWISNKEFLPVPDVVVQLYDKDGKILYANKTQANGYFLTNKEYPDGVYFLKLSSNSLMFPSVKIVLEKNFTKKPIKITSL
jgi:hypothetical protein